MILPERESECVYGICDGSGILIEAGLEVPCLCRGDVEDDEPTPIEEVL